MGDSSPPSYTDTVRGFSIHGPIDPSDVAELEERLGPGVRPIFRPRWVSKDPQREGKFKFELLLRPLPDRAAPTYEESTGENSRGEQLIYTALEANQVTAGSSRDSTFRYSRCTGMKKAACINLMRAVNEHDYTYRGDVIKFTDLLEHTYGFVRSNVRVFDYPDRQEIIDAMRWLVEDAQADDSLVFLFVGLGGQVRDSDGDEDDGFDEYICPADWKTAGVILDDEMFEIMAKDLPAGCRLTAFFDCSHSGTALDLPYTYTSSGRVKGDDNSFSMARLTQKQKQKHDMLKEKRRQMRMSKGDIISWSSCEDGKTSTGTNRYIEFPRDPRRAYYLNCMFIYERVFMTELIASLTENRNQIYEELLKSLRDRVHSRCRWRLLPMQKPQLSSSHPIDTKRKFIM